MGGVGPWGGVGWGPGERSGGALWRDVGEAMTFDDMPCVKTAEFLKTQRELKVAASLRAMVAGKVPKRSRARKLTKKQERAHMRCKLRNKKKRTMMKAFVAEIRKRSEEGYSVKQLVSSHIPDIGVEAKIDEKDVTAALKTKDWLVAWTLGFPTHPRAGT